ncbi:hypothetical protein FQN54_006806 [Arachnomyces sp. PD_36]|nr:hypothetical protein FQN54_006806 [Arachnomyces sp. PD_36]
MSAPNLDTIPFDILHQIASGLPCQDYVNLSRVNRSLHFTLQDESIARRSAESYLAHTKEVKFAQDKTISYREAIGRTFNVREALATAQPYSVMLLAFGDSFVYNEGILCYLWGDYIRVLDVHGASKGEAVLNIGETLRGGRFQYAPGTGGAIHLSLLHYSNRILACLCEIEGHPGAWLIALDITCTNPEKSPIVIFRSLVTTRNLFVRHNGRHLYYGTLSVPTPDGHYEWLLQGVDMKTKQSLDSSVHLKNFVGSELGQSVCFEIYGDHLYAVSNQTSAVEEEVDWTSYYCCLRISLEDGQKTPIRRIWRRQHREGPINDSWTDLSLHTDSETGVLVIMECRREWQNGGSENFRTYYSQPLDCFDGKGQKHSVRLGPTQLPRDEPLTSTLGPNDKPNYEPPKKRICRNYHPEYSRDEQPADRRDFILAKTKYHTYNPSASTFLDIVNDPTEQSTLTAPPDRLRLRIGSRKRKCPIDENGEEGEKGLLYPPEHTKDGTKNTPLELSDERFVSRGIHLWPPPNAPSELLDILCPSGRAGRVEAVSDERTLIYSTEECEPGALRPIILVNFDPSIQFKGLKRLGSQTVRASKDNTPIDIDIVRPSECRDKPRSVELRGPSPGAFPESSQKSQKQPRSHSNGKSVKYIFYSFYVEKPLYSRINQGYWVR